MQVYSDGTFSVDAEKFPKITATASSGSRRSDTIFFSLQGFNVGEMKKVSEILKRDNFFLRKSEKGNIVICAGKDTTSRTLVLVDISDGFRGSSGIYEKSQAQIIGQARSSSALDGTTVIAAIIQEGNPLVL